MKSTIMGGHADEHGGPVFVDRGNYFLREGINIGKNLSLRHKGARTENSNRKCDRAARW